MDRFLHLLLKLHSLSHQFSLASALLSSAFYFYLISRFSYQQVRCAPQLHFHIYFLLNNHSPIITKLINHYLFSIRIMISHLKPPVPQWPH